VGVRCPGCGREYDDARFAYGRTLHCACGSRVAAEPAAPPPVVDEPRFQVDAMLGRLARWLRLLGFDAAWEADVSDAELVRGALDEGRWILTRDRALPVEWRVAPIHVVASETTGDQLQEVVRAFDLAPRVRPFARCSRCNALIAPLDAARARPLVPARVADAQTRFFGCPGCGRVYWEGTHVERMRRVIERVLAPT
jgi:uncharacterized protein with PIN domain